MAEDDGEGGSTLVFGSQYVSDQTSSILTPDAFELLTLEEWVHYLSVLLISNTKDSIMEIAFFHYCLPVNHFETNSN